MASCDFWIANANGEVTLRRMTTQLRNLMKTPGILVIPCAYDCISARIIEKIGFKAVLHGGLNSTGCLLGMPDVGLITMTEMLTHARNIANAVSIPVIADVDVGFGEPVNVMRTTREAIRAGVAGMYMEDQLLPKRCGHLDDKAVVPTEEMLYKLKAAIDVRDQEDRDFVLIARTDAATVLGIDEAIGRGIEYAKAGADVIFPDAISSHDDLLTYAKKVSRYAPVLVNMVETGKTPVLTNPELEKMGFKIVIWSVSAILAAANAVTEVMDELKTKGTTKGLIDRMMSLHDFAKLTGIEEVRESEQKFGLIRKASK